MMSNRLTRPLPYLTLGVISVLLGFSLIKAPLGARSSISESPADDETPPFVFAEYNPGEGLNLTSTDNRTILDLNANSFSQTTEIKLYSLSSPYGFSDWRKWMTGFLLHAQPPADESADPLDNLNAPAEVTILYEDSSLSGDDESLLKLLFWDEEGQEWVDASTTCPTGTPQQLDQTSNQVVVSICRTGEYGLMIDKEPIETYLPLIQSGDSEVLSVPPDLEPDSLNAPTDSCSQLVTNGNFEKNTGWTIHGSTRPAIYTTSRSLNGVRSMRTGIFNSDYDLKSFSIFSQVVNIPAGASSATLTFYLYQKSTDPTATDGAGITLPGIQSLDGSPRDINYVGLYDLNDNLVADFLVWERSNARIWTGYSFNLIGFNGKSLRIKFGTYNDGEDGITSMYVDAVSLMACSAAATPMIQNGDFEKASGWNRLNTPIPAIYSTARFHSGKQSMLAGITQKGSGAKGYSLFEQMVTIPDTVTNPTLQFYWWGQSGESNLNTLPAQSETDLELAGADANDIQYVAIMDLNHQVLEYPMWRRSNDRAWVLSSYDLTPYIGQKIILRFGVYNDGDGDVTAMYVDDVSITASP